MRSSNLTRV